MVISASLQACGVVFPFAMLTSICRSIVTICSGLYLLIGMTRFSSKWILSHSTWYKFRRSRQDQIQSFLIPLPSLSKQRDFARCVVAVEKAKAIHRASLGELDALFAVLQHRAFRGEL